MYKLRNRTGAEGFSAAWDAAIERGFTRLEDCALERAIAGEERPVVWDGKVVTTWKRYDTALLMFLLRQRRSEKYGNVRMGELRPGHPVYEKLRAEWRAESEASGAEARASVMAKLMAMREARAADAAAGQADEGAPEGR